MALRHYQLDPPKDWQEFERLCHRLWMKILNDPNTLMHGRQGQSQCGVDIYGVDSETSKFYGVQCKGKDKQYGAQVTEKELHAEVAKALTFHPDHPQVFILATTAARDRNIQKVARQITKDNNSTNKMRVYVYCWDDIVSRCEMYPSIIEEFYPHLSEASCQLSYNMGEIEKSVKNVEAYLLKPSDAVLKLHNKSQVLKYFFEASNGLLSWPRTLHSNDIWIDRVEEEDITIQFDADLSSSSIILGDPGTGKSALLSKIAQSLVDNGEIVLAIKADQLDQFVEDFTTLGQNLGLPGPIDECLKIGSQFGRIFIFIDQLDTLSELVDVKTSRLSVLLNLIKQLRFDPNIHVIASSRSFEFDHDVRLSSIKAQKIQLLPVKWEVTENVLKDSGVYLSGVDQNFKNFLCKPNNLNFYLDYLINNPEKHFVSHIELYEDIWRSSLGVGVERNRRSAFLLEVASIMTNDAKQALPIVRYEQYLTDIDFLTDAGILVKNSSNKSFSFAHQTLQAFVWTRSFIKQNSSLIDFIITHQNDFNVRPKLSTVLFYLRDSDVDEYNSQVTSVLITNLSSIRRHIVHLIIECIGVHHDPNSFEVAALKHLINDNYYQGRICKAVSGKAQWFDNFKNDIVPSLMEGSSTSKFVATFILSSALEDRHVEVMTLIDRYWKTTENVNYIFYTLRSASHWNPQVFELAKYLIAHESIQDYVPGELYRVVAEKSAAMAIQLTAYFFNSKLQRLMDTPREPTPPIAENATGLEKYIHSEDYSVRRRYEGIMNFGTNWHSLEEVAEKAPQDFIENFWSFFVLACEKTRSTYHYDNNSYYDCAGDGFHLSDERHSYHGEYFAEALELSIKLYASNSKQAFLQLYNASKQSEILPVQRLLMKGLCEIASDEPAFVLGELLSDKRRMKLGSMQGDKYTGTREFISKLSQFLDDNQRKKLQDYIMSYTARESESGASVETRQYDLKCNRKVRYDLLTAIGESYFSEALKRYMCEEGRALGLYVESGFGKGRVKLRRQVSPMSEEQLEKAKESDIINCFKVFPDSREYDRLTDDTYAGAMEFRRTFEKFAEKNPQKAISIMKQLTIANQLAVGCGLVGLSKSDIDHHELLNLIDLLEPTFHSLDFYDDAARAISNKLNTEQPLSEDWLEKIAGWIVVKPTEDVPGISAKQDSENGDEDNSDDEKISSIIWERGRIYGVPSGNYQILCTLTVAYLLRDKPMSFEWSNKVVRYIKQKDSVAVWRGFLGLKFPRAICVCNPDEIESIVDAIIESYPEVTKSTELAFTLAECVKHVSEYKLFAWLDLTLDSNTSKSSQIYGEILGIKWIIDSLSDETNNRINELIQTRDVYGLCGLAFTLKNIWQYRKKQITSLYVRLIEVREKNVTTILLGLLHSSDLVQSNELNTIVDSFIANRSFELTDNPDSFIAHCMLPLIPHEPMRVAQVCNALIAANGKNLGDISTGASAGTSDMITIAITIHNMGKEYQKIGLEIFEKLIDVGAYQVQEALRKIDAIPQIRMKI